MQSFERLTLAELPVLRPLLTAAAGRQCDDTVGGVFLWRDFFQTSYLLRDGTLLMSVVLPESGEQAFCMPVGGDAQAALTLLEDCARAQGRPLVFGAVSADQLPLLRARWPEAEITEETDLADYLYDFRQFTELPGRHLAPKRNHVHRFYRCYPQGGAVLLTEERLPEALAYYDYCVTAREKSTLSFLEDRSKGREVLEHWEECGFDGALLYADGRVVGMAVGEVRRDVLYVHIEKAESTVPGAYQVLAAEFPELLARPELRLINREDDAGDPGLRAAKQSYMPQELLRKYRVRV